MPALWKSSYKDIFYSKVEQVWAIALDKNYHHIKTQKIAEGDRYQCCFQLSSLIFFLTSQNAKSFILLHNHIDGGVYPSKKDVEMTRQLVESLKSSPFEFWDHWIFYEEEFFSFRLESLVFDFSILLNH